MKISASALREKPGALRRFWNAAHGTGTAEWMPPSRRALIRVPRSAFRVPGCLVLPFLAAALLLAGCARSGPTADLVIINGAEPESLDPGLLTGQADGRVALELFEGLTRYDPTNASPSAGTFRPTAGFTPSTSVPTPSGPPANRSRRAILFIHGCAC